MKPEGKAAKIASRHLHLFPPPPPPPPPPTSAASAATAISTASAAAVATTAFPATGVTPVLSADNVVVYLGQTR